jgi:GNAT superfamily N-acetyltransferase
LAWAEERARVLSEQAPAGVRTVLQVNLFENETTAIQLFSNCGYANVREWTHMELLMDAPPPTSSLPDGFILREMDLDNDWDIVGPAMDDAFTDHWGTIPPGTIESSAEENDDDDSDSDETPSDDSFSNAPGYCFIVLDGDTVAGGVLCNAKLVERNDTGRVGSIFVRSAYRRRKIGQALMLTAFNAFWQKGVKRIILDTDSESFSQSRIFYSGLGMTPYRCEFLYEKEIRPGREVRRLEK